MNLLATLPFTLRQLQYLVAVADHESFRHAADACHVSQPSLSAQVAQVEEALELVVFDRSRRPVAVTPAGAELVAHARRVLTAARALAEA
ncbi:MAG: LysR family transcriptional regulator, partial [Deltaproteobacteria bacterium]